MGRMTLFCPCPKSSHRTTGNAVFCVDSVRNFIDHIDTATTTGTAADARRTTAPTVLRNTFDVSDGRTRPQAAPPPPVRRASRRPRAAWAPPARRRSQPARGRRPVRGAVRSRRNKAAQRSPLRRRCCSGVYAGAGAGRLTVSPYCSSFGFAQTCFPPNDVNSFCFLLLII